MDAWKIVTLVVVVVALGCGGYFVNEGMQCNALEEDYLNSIAGLKGDAAIGAIVSSPELDNALKRRRELELKAGEVALSRLYERCGERAGKTAVRKGQDILLGGSIY